MEVQDGFIVGIYNYCDRWCELCALTSRCHLFADQALHEAGEDASFKDLIAAPPHLQDVREPLPWLVEVIDEIDMATEQALTSVSTTTVGELNSALPAPYEQISRRAKDYAMHVHEWWQREFAELSPGPTDPRSVILWFATLTAAKIYRALTGLVDFDGDREFPPDHEGSAKVALIGIDRSLHAWRDLVSVAVVTMDAAAPFIADLTFLGSSLEGVIPRARQFVRPGFDEPDEVRQLEAGGD